MPKYYTCSICGKKFENYSTKKFHQTTCGMVGLDKFTDETTDGKANASFK